MLPQMVYYFRFEPFIDPVDGRTYYAPPDFKSGRDYYEGYDMSPFTISHRIKRDVDFEPDTFTVVVDAFFFQNPYNLMQHNRDRTTDVKNAFEPTANHVVVIGPSPKDVHQRASGGNIDSYCYEDEYPEISGPVFGMVKEFKRTGADKMTLICASFLKNLGDFQLGTDFKLNGFEDELNDLQVFYEYNDDERLSSSPFFPKKEITRMDTMGYNTIEPAIKTTDRSEVPPRFPMFDYGTVRNPLPMEGYEAPKIAWRLLQEIGWCRDAYKGEPLKKFNASLNHGVLTVEKDGAIISTDEFVDSGGINPYQRFKMTADETDPRDCRLGDKDGEAYGTGEGPGFILGDRTIADNVFWSVDERDTTSGWLGFVTDDGDKFNPNVMIGSESDFCFTAFDTDGLRYDYSVEETTVGGETSEHLTETFYSNFDPSRQSILYNLKNLADSDGLYINMTCCPRFAAVEGVNNSTMVWDYRRVYGNLNNLKRWGVTAGFRPKVMLRKNMSHLREDSVVRRVAGRLEYGVHNNDPTSRFGSSVLAKRPMWETDRTDVVNKLSIKYGQGSNEMSKYIEVPYESARERYFYVEIIGEVKDFPTITTISIAVGENDVFRVSRTYDVGVKDHHIADDIKNVYDTSNPYVEITNTGNVLIITAKTTEVSDYWNEHRDSVYMTITKTSGVTDPDFGSNIVYMAEEPAEFALARESQKRNDIRTQKLSFPEVSQLKDVLSIAANMFKKYAEEKHRCVVDCSDVNSWQMAIFELYNIVDDTSTKEVLNDEGAMIKFTVTGTAASSGLMTCMLPFPDSSDVFSFDIVVNETDGPDDLIDALLMEFNNVMGDNADVITVSKDGNAFVVSYRAQEKFADISSFADARLDTDALGITVTKATRQPSLFKQATYDEYLMLLNYEASSDTGTYTCTFGIPTETLSNIINQSDNWIADIEKSQ